MKILLLLLLCIIFCGCRTEISKNIGIADHIHQMPKYQIDNFRIDTSCNSIKFIYNKNRSYSPDCSRYVEYAYSRFSRMYEVKVVSRNYIIKLSSCASIFVWLKDRIVFSQSGYDGEESGYFIIDFALRDTMFIASQGLDIIGRTDSLIYLKPDKHNKAFIGGNRKLAKNTVIKLGFGYELINQFEPIRDSLDLVYYNPEHTIFWDRNVKSHLDVGTNGDTIKKQFILYYPPALSISTQNSLLVAELEYQGERLGVSDYVIYKIDTDALKEIVGIRRLYGSCVPLVDQISQFRIFGNIVLLMLRHGSSPYNEDKFVAYDYVEKKEVEFKLYE